MSRSCRIVVGGTPRGRFPTLKSAIAAAKRRANRHTAVDVECCDGPRSCWLQAVVTRDRRKARVSRV